MWKIVHVFDGDYGCEEIEASNLSLTIEDENGSKVYKRVTEKWLVDKGLDVGSEWPYQFWGWENVETIHKETAYSRINSIYDMYEALQRIWCAETCAPRMRDGWSENDKTRGQCSITSFLVQDIFGGEVYGILREGGNYHCYNVIDNCKFDLTSEQFHGEELSYENNPIQSRKVHFSKEEKKERYELLKEKLSKYCEDN